MMKKLLFISTNDGSDMRINKEVKTLSEYCDIIYLGVGQETENNYAKAYCKEFYLINAKRNSLKAILLQKCYFFKIILKNRIHTVHIINEQLMIFFYPYLFFFHTILDIFDSIFLKKGYPGEKLLWLKRIIYLPINKIIVTDSNRASLMPKSIRKKVIVLENYPYQFHNLKKKVNKSLTILYNGSMSVSRGTTILKNLLEKFPEMNVIAIGWIADEETRDFMEMNNVDFLGVMSQKDAITIASEVDYIMCCYEPSNLNNINASPNKIYDAIQTQTPLIINAEVKVSTFVKENNLGIIIPSFYTIDYEWFYEQLNEKKDTFIFDVEMATTYSWEYISKKLIEAHKLP